VTARIFDDFGAFVLRTPLLPIDALCRWSDDLSAPIRTTSDEALLEQALQADRHLLWQRLQIIYRDDTLRDALAISSPSLSRALEKHLEDRVDVVPARMLRAMVRFLGRATVRTEPYALFAGWSVGEFGKANSFKVVAPSGYVRRCRVSFRYLNRLLHKMRQTRPVTASTRLWLAAGVYRIGGAWRYSREGAVASAAAEPGVDLLLTRAREGGTRRELVAALMDRIPGVEAAEASAFVDELVQEGLLASAPGLLPVETAPVRAVGQTLGDLDRATTRSLQDAETALGQLGPDSVGMSRVHETIVSRLPAMRGAPSLVQVDLLKPTPDLRLNGEVIEDLTLAAEMVLRLARPRRCPLERFRAAFVERYGGREVPLAEALDPDAGVGFDRPMAVVGAAVPFDSLPPPVPPEVPKRDSIASLLGAYLAPGQQEVSLVPEQVRLAAPLPPDCAGTLTAKAVLMAGSPAALDRGDFRWFLKEVCAGPAIRMLGRMAAVDPAVRAIGERIAAFEQASRSDSVLAEICYVPKRRGDLAARADLYPYRLIFSNEARHPDDRNLPLEDLWVSVQGHRVALRSERLDRWVLPRLSTMCAVWTRDPTLYRFLVAVQFQDVSRGAAWSWGALAGLPVLPRVRVGRSVLARARWRLAGRDARELASTRTDIELFRIAKGWQAVQRAPRWLAAYVGHGPEMVVDFDSILSLESLRHLVRSHPSVYLFEMLPAPGEGGVESGAGAYAHDILVPLARRDTEPVERSSYRRAPPAWPRHVPGSRWVYVKLFAGPMEQDRLLREAVPQLVDNLRRRGLLSNWFFIRYGPPSHLRLRFEVIDDEAVDKVASRVRRVAARLAADGAIWQVQFDTYDPEVPRYGGSRAMPLVERVFGVDSDTVLDLLSGPGSAPDRSRWEVAVLGIHRFCSGLKSRGVDLDRLLARRLAKFQMQMSLYPRFGRWVRQNCRRELPRLRDLLTEAGSESEALTILRRRDERLLPLLDSLLELTQSRQLTGPASRIWTSLIHMYANKLFRTVTRTEEDILLDLLRQHYRSEQGRLRHNPPS
jgi:thiopeptide-type bacteriocin biosynthesis protein